MLVGRSSAQHQTILSSTEHGLVGISFHRKLQLFWLQFKNRNSSNKVSENEQWSCCCKFIFHFSSKLSTRHCSQLNLLEMNW